MTTDIDKDFQISDVLRGRVFTEQDEDFSGIYPLAEDLDRSGKTLLPIGNLRAPTKPVVFDVDPTGEPQKNGTKYYVIDKDNGRRFYVGRVQKYYKRRGMSRISAEQSYDRLAAERQVGLWAHFIWPTVMAEGRGRLIVINAYDRAHFTWGFYQLAAHTPRANLILLMRQLLKLPSAKFYFPDLKIVKGRVTRSTADGDVDLENETYVPDHDEYQLLEFMRYLNPNSQRVEEEEVITCAKIIDWARSDPRMLDETTRVSVEVMKEKLRERVDQLSLNGRRPEVVIWISDILHHGRGYISTIEKALRKPTFDEQLEALSKIDFTGQHSQRRKNVKKYVNKLIKEKRYENERFGEGDLSL